MGIFGKTNSGMKKTRDKLSANLDAVLDSFEEVGDDLFDELTELLVMGDVGVYTSEAIIEQTKKLVSERNIRDPQGVRQAMKEVVADMLGKDQTIDFLTSPAVILVIGVNGVGKTTTIGKMAAFFKSQGQKVILGAADTFRAAAIDQLQIWAERAGVDLVKHAEGADPAAVVFDTINAGINRNADVIIIDTAGRIHNKKNLMDELNKIFRVIDRELPYSDREIFLVLDATTGQNAISQAKEFMKVADVSGIVLTKLDGTARGGVVLSIKNDLKLPVKFIGVGEGIDDLQPFSATAFASSLFDSVSEEEQEALERKIEENMNLSVLPEETPDEERELTKKEEKAKAKAEAEAAKAAEEAARAAEEEKARRKAEQKAKEQAKKEAYRKQLEEEAAARAAAEAAEVAAKATAEATADATPVAPAVEAVPEKSPTEPAMTAAEEKAAKKAAKEEAKKQAEKEKIARMIAKEREKEAIRHEKLMAKKNRG
jgi:fused signal recognition particle receptor